MTDPIIMWIISGLAGTAILLLGAIWKELRYMRNKLENVIINNTSLAGRMLILEKITDKLPCLNNLKCPSKQESYHA